jgi:quinol monooxygenase YgiN
VIVVTGDLRVAPENLGKLREAMRRVIEVTRKEDGCLSYAFAEDVLEPGLVRISERWLNMQSLEAHGNSAHVAEWKATLKRTGVIHREVVAFEAGQGRPI